jgi:hypothetical protein
MPYAYFTLVKLKAPRGRFLRWGGIFLNNDQNEIDYVDQKTWPKVEGLLILVLSY